MKSKELCEIGACREQASCRHEDVDMCQKHYDAHVDEDRIDDVVEDCHCEACTHASFILYPDG